jgi:hypothetical protein
MWPHKHRHNLKEGILEKSKLAPYAYEGHRVGCDDAKILETESNSRYRKYEESVHMACLTNVTGPFQFGYLSHHTDSPYQQQVSRS